MWRQSRPAASLNRWPPGRGRKIVYIPLGSLSPHKLKQLRILHILSGKDNVRLQRNMSGDGCSRDQRWCGRRIQLLNSMLQSQPLIIGFLGASLVMGALHRRLSSSGSIIARPVLPSVHHNARVGPFCGRPPYRWATFVIQRLAAKERGWLAARQRLCRPDSSLCRSDGACSAWVAGDRVLSDGFMGSAAGMGAGISDRGCFVRLFGGVYAIVAGFQGGAETSV